MHILGISGSLRKGSWNTAALRAVQGMLPAGTTLDIAEIGDLPLMNQDLERDGKYPEPVERFRKQVLGADALLFATPEYNASIPAPLKNAIDRKSSSAAPARNSTPTASSPTSPRSTSSAKWSRHF
jgi:chromate reductase